MFPLLGHPSRVSSLQMCGRQHGQVDQNAMNAWPSLRHGQTSNKTSSSISGDNDPYLLHGNTQESSSTLSNYSRFNPWFTSNYWSNHMILFTNDFGHVFDDIIATLTARLELFGHSISMVIAENCIKKLFGWCLKTSAPPKKGMSFLRRWSICQKTCWESMLRHPLSSIVTGIHFFCPKRVFVEHLKRGSESYHLGQMFGKLWCYLKRTW